MNDENEFNVPGLRANLNVDDQGRFFWQQDVGPMQPAIPPAPPPEFAPGDFDPEPLTNLDKLRAIREVYLEHGDQPPDLIDDLIDELREHEDNLHVEWERGFNAGNDRRGDDAYHRGVEDGREGMEEDLEKEYDRGFKDGKEAREL